MKLQNILGIAVAGIALATTAVKAETVVGSVALQWGSSYYSSNYGGEFQATLNLIDPSPSPLASQASTVEIGSNSSTATPSVFQTFCIQEGSNDVVFYPGYSYAAVFETTAQSHNDSLSDVEALNPVTQVLFAEFWNGTLPGYLSNSSRINSAGELQDAIWFAQGDNTLIGGEGDAGINNDVQALIWYTDALDYTIDSNVADLGGGSADGYKSVEILGLYSTVAGAENNDPSTIAQAQLVELNPAITANSPPFAPLPASANEMIVLLGGLGILRLVRRARRLA